MRFCEVPIDVRGLSGHAGVVQMEAKSRREWICHVTMKLSSPSVWVYMAPIRITFEYVNLSVAPCSVNRAIYDALTSKSSLVLYGFKSPNWQLDAV